MNLMRFTEMSKERQYNSLRRAVIKLGFSFFESGDYDLNIIAVRNGHNLQSTKFNDLVCVAYLKDGIKCVDAFEATTDPGRTYRLKPINKKGTAVIIPQQVKGGLKIGLHKGYKALVQNKSFWVLRDNDKNGNIPEMSMLTMPELKTIYTFKGIGVKEYFIIDKYGVKMCGIELGIFGTNFHRASKWKLLESVGLYSAGCVVQRDPYKYRDIFLPLVDKSAAIFGDTFTMTLITNDLLTTSK